MISTTLFHRAVFIHEIKPQLFLGAAYCGKKCLVLCPGLAATHGGLKLSQHGELFSRINTGRFCTGTQRGERR